MIRILAVLSVATILNVGAEDGGSGGEGPPPPPTTSGEREFSLRPTMVGQSRPPSRPRPPELLRHGDADKMQNCTDDDQSAFRQCLDDKKAALDQAHSDLKASLTAAGTNATARHQLEAQFFCDMAQRAIMFAGSCVQLCRNPDGSCNGMSDLGQMCNGINATITDDDDYGNHTDDHPGETQGAMLIRLGCQWNCTAAVPAAVDAQLAQLSGPVATAVGQSDASMSFPSALMATGTIIMQALLL